MSHLAARIGEPLAYGETRAPSLTLEALVAGLGLSPVDAVHYANGDIELVAGVVAHEITAVSIDALAGTLQVASELGLRCWLGQPTGDGAVSDPAGDLIHQRTTPLGSLSIRRHGQRLEQRVEIFGVEASTLVLTDRLAQLSRQGMSLGSSRLRAFAERGPIVRAPTLSPAELAKRVAAGVLPDWPVLSRFEADAGFVCPWSHDPIGRPALMLGLSLVLNTTGVLHDEWSWSSEEEVSELELIAWPRFRYHGVEMVFVGEHYHRHYILIDEEGVLWRFEHELSLMRVVAQSPRVLLELAALDDALWSRPAWANVIVDADAGAQVAEALSLHPDESATDDIVQCFDDGDLWLRQTRAHGGVGPRLAIAGDTTERIVVAAQSARDHHPKAQIHIDETRPGGREREAALRSHGLLS